MSVKRKAKRKGDPVLQTLEDIKRLLAMQLITSGIQATDVARTLRVTKSVVSGLVPTRKIRKRRKKR